MTAVLAAMLVASVKVGACKFDSVVVAFHLYIVKQPENRGKLNADRDTSNFSIIFCYYFGLFLKEHAHRSLPGNNLQRFVSCVQNQGLHTLDCFMLHLTSKDIYALFVKRMAFNVLFHQILCRRVTVRWFCFFVTIFRQCLAASPPPWLWASGPLRSPQTSSY